MQGMKGNQKKKDEKIKESIMADVSECNPKTETLVEFVATEDECNEDTGVYQMDLRRVGNLNSRVEIHWEVISEDAIEGEHFSVDISSLIFE